MLLSGIVGLVRRGSPNSELPLSLTADGALHTQAARGRYRSSVARGNVYGATTQASGALSVGLSTTYTGLCISNPIGSGFNLSMLACRFAASAAAASTADAAIIGGFSATTNVTHTAAGTIENCLFSSASVQSIAKADTSATIPTPTYKMMLTGATTSATLPTSYDPQGFTWLDGLYELPPGGFIALGGTVGVSTGWCSFIWEEIPV